MVYLDCARGGGRSRPPGDTSNAVRSSSGSSIFIVSRTLAGRGYCSVLSSELVIYIIAHA